MPFMRYLLAILLLAASAVCGASDRTYAVLSLIGDQLMLVNRAAATGSNVDRNTRQFVALPNAALDNAALRAVEDALKTADPGAQVALLAARDPDLAKAQAKALDAGGGAGLVLPALKDVLAKVNATHLILVSKHRGEARMEIANGKAGSGYLEGLGFYIDRLYPLRDLTTGEHTDGFLAPFAYFRVALIDLATSRVLGEETVTASQGIGARDQINPWDTLSSAEKVAYLDGFIREGAQRVVTRLVTAK